MFTLFHNQYLPLSFQCLSDIDNIKVQHVIEICIDQNVNPIFVHFYTAFTWQEIDSAAKPFLVWLTRLYHGGFLKKNWINCKHIVLYLFCIQKVSIRGKSRDIFKRTNDCFQGLFFSTAVSKSIFSQEILFHCYSYFWEFWYLETILQTQLPSKQARCFFL